ncbi:Os02g0827500, partial [Oryza sativa Japonica Group]
DLLAQVPLSLAIKISSVRGVLRVHVKPPPSDQLWYGFTSMPDLEWDIESSIGDRKITNSHIGSLIGNRFKVVNTSHPLLSLLLLFQPTCFNHTFLLLRLHSVTVWCSQTVKVFPYHLCWQKRMTGYLSRMHLLFGSIVSPLRPEATLQPLRQPGLTKLF